MAEEQLPTILHDNDRDNALLRQTVFDLIPVLIHSVHPPLVGLMGYELFCDIPSTEVLARFDLLEPDEIVVQISVSGQKIVGRYRFQFSAQMTSRKQPLLSLTPAGAHVWSALIFQFRLVATVLSHAMGY